MESTFSARRTDIMEVRMESKKGTVVSGIDPVLAEIQKRLQAHPQEWLKALKQNPGGFANLEQEIHRTFAHLADHVVAGLLAQATTDSAFADTAKKKWPHRFEAEITRRRVASAQSAIAGRVADLCDDDLLQPGTAYGARPWP
jgi:hypothetical protein